MLKYFLSEALRHNVKYALQDPLRLLPAVVDTLTVHPGEVET